MPAPGGVGTRVEVRDLFYKVPARLKFLRSERTEAEAAEEVVRRLALARPDLAFALTVDGRQAFRAEPAGELFADALLHRLGTVLGREFVANAIQLDAEREGIRLQGYIGLPTFSRRDARQQHLFVNRRPVQDRLLKQALRAAYSDLLFHDRQPVAALFLELPPELVDVNVHPAKAEVRFREAGLVRGLVIGALKRALAEHGHRSAAAGGARPGRIPAGRRAAIRQPDRPRRARRRLAAGPAAGGPGRGRAQRARQRRGPDARGRAATRWVPRAPSCTAAGSWPRPKPA